MEAAVQGDADALTACYRTAHSTGGGLHSVVELGYTTSAKFL